MCGAERFEVARKGHLALVDQIAAPDLDGVDADFGGDGIEQPLAHERALVAAGRAVGAAGRLVGEADMADGAIGRHAVGAGQHRRGEIGHRGGVGAHIAALVVEEFVVDAEDAPVGVDGGANVMGLLARMVGGDQVFAAVFDPFHRPAEPQRGERRPAHLPDRVRRGCRSRRRHGLRNRWTLSGERPSMRAIWSRFQCGTLAAPYISSMSVAAS